MTSEELEKPYGVIEKVIYFFLIPTLFTAILVLALFALLDKDWKNTLLSYGQQVPIVKTFLPPAADKKPTLNLSESAEGDNSQVMNEINNLKSDIEKRDAELKKSIEELRKKEDEVKSLKIENEKLQEGIKTKTQKDEEYVNKIKELASVFGKMSPSKAAPILENLSLPEIVLILNEMKIEERTKVLEKMTPKIAADSSILLKDVQSVKDQDIAALQERLNKQTLGVTTQSQSTSGNLLSTISTMPAKTAANVLTEMMKSNSEKVYSLMNQMNSQARSQILSELPVNLAAQITSKLSE